MLGLTEALELAGWRWLHIIRSDGVTAGSSGFPDLIAVHPHRAIVLAWELKSDRGQLTPDQAGWLIGLRERAIDARVIRPADYDEALQVILGARDPAPGGSR